MVRSPMGSASYWNEWCSYADEHIAHMTKQISEPAGDPSYRPQYVFNLVRKHYEQMLRRYSRGDAITELRSYFPPLLDAWEESERLGYPVWTAKQQYTRHAWKVNLDHYIVCFWLVGLALVLEIPDDQWQRLITLVGNEGEDALLDRVIASRQSGRKIGAALCHPRPYERLLDAVNAPRAEQALLLSTFLEKWHLELHGPPARGLAKTTAMKNARPYWHRYGEQNFEGGAYFGRWCVEAVAAVKAFGMDDSLCLGHADYPGDLLRPGKLTTHLPSPRREQTADFPLDSGVAKQSRPGWFARIFGGL